jgi:hypothetical protein
MGVPRGSPLPEPLAANGSRRRKPAADWQRRFHHRCRQGAGASLFGTPALNFDYGRGIIQHHSKPGGVRCGRCYEPKTRTQIPISTRQQMPLLRLRQSKTPQISTVFSLPVSVSRAPQQVDIIKQSPKVLGGWAYSQTNHYIRKLSLSMQCAWVKIPFIVTTSV